MPVCCLCNGYLVFIGQLGQSKQFRCRHCGMIFSAVRPNRSKNKKLKGEQGSPHGQDKEENHKEENHKANP